MPTTELTALLDEVAYILSIEYLHPRGLILSSDTVEGLREKYKKLEEHYKQLAAHFES